MFEVNKNEKLSIYYNLKEVSLSHLMSIEGEFDEFYHFVENTSVQDFLSGNFYDFNVIKYFDTDIEFLKGYFIKDNSERNFLAIINDNNLYIVVD